MILFCNFRHGCSDSAFAYSEPEYVVRFEPISRKLEIGFESDNWVIGG